MPTCNKWDFSGEPEQFWPEALPDATVIPMDDSGIRAVVGLVKVQCLKHWPTAAPLHIASNFGI